MLEPTVSEPTVSEPTVNSGPSMVVASSTSTDSLVEQLAIDALPTMRDLDGLQLELDEVDRVLAELDGVRDATRSAGR